MTRRSSPSTLALGFLVGVAIRERVRSRRVEQLWAWESAQAAAASAQAANAEAWAQWAADQGRPDVDEWDRLADAWAEHAAAWADHVGARVRASSSPAGQRDANVIPINRADRDERRWMQREEAYSQWCFDHQISHGPSARALFDAAWEAGRSRPRRSGT